MKSVLAHPGVAVTGLQPTSAALGGMNLGSDVMAKAQSAEDGALGIIRACSDSDVAGGDFFGLVGYAGIAVKLPPEALLTDATNIRINWEGCEAAVGAFAI